eukprot:TRINITY_DN55_c3_g1_i2.p2 TRINITY_DN55_c3_g1~~TRINITY_DN55_c3_g1_i2.p2  ORF type:complete len:221 (+),score=26.60 TRINITY_DN55_c3_g1_i2:92-754(+)
MFVCGCSCRFESDPIRDSTSRPRPMPSALLIWLNSDIAPIERAVNGAISSSSMSLSRMPGMAEPGRLVLGREVLARDTSCEISDTADVAGRTGTTSGGSTTGCRIDEIGRCMPGITALIVVDRLGVIGRGVAFDDCGRNSWLSSLVRRLKPEVGGRLPMPGRGSEFLRGRSHGGTRCLESGERNETDACIGLGGRSSTSSTTGSLNDAFFRMRFSTTTVA